MKEFFLSRRMARVLALGIMISLGAFSSLANSPPPNIVLPAPSTGGSQSPSLSYAVNEVTKMYQGGIGKNVILSYVNSSMAPYHLSADGILYLHRLGFPEEVTQAMIQRDGQLQQQLGAQQQFYQQPTAAMAAQNASMAAQSSSPIVTPTTPAPAVNVIGSDYPYYGDDYPYYGGYAGYYGWPVVGGWGWGYGGYGGFRGGFHSFRGGFGRGGFAGGFRGGGGGFRRGFAGGGFRSGGSGGSHGGFGGSHSGGHGGGGGHR
jgi:hypothetical protein